LKLLGRKYKIFKQQFFQDYDYGSKPSNFDFEIFANFLCSMGNYIYKVGNIKDAETVFLLSVALKKI
jgi:hypothetical protein